MKIEIGKYYRDRKGRRYGPMMGRTYNSIYPFQAADEIGEIENWDQDGSYVAGKQSDYDLIAETHAPLQETSGIRVWRCHKEVWAAKIIDVPNWPNQCRELELEPSPIGARVLVVASDDFHNRLARMPHSPVGGYYVRYADGYESWSPAEAFESGYSRID